MQTGCIFASMEWLKCVREIMDNSLYQSNDTIKNEFVLLGVNNMIMRPQGQDPYP